MLWIYFANFSLKAEEWTFIQANVLQQFWSNPKDIHKDVQGSIRLDFLSQSDYS